ncbi:MULTISPECIES: TetR/AcrR family transcriptional regulator [unclassified Streptomyces]|uniref:TetR/AcrR family transcriptional regulator n=1 Tax=unclassified Streptomyces TaxID=2593676 RepID=UPI001F04FF35|nr:MULTISPECIES: TetR/AcrR family transcriptional regulator [unclassified Streptomyces]MCH0567402.1 TetR/AcrR family transcriptional regulator [Streptomyces sp. MUM 2J]MCH0570664.1 TetR/AcrR family transcriptional regulator [Streptomyces sp. MUM 136J]
MDGSDARERALDAAERLFYARGVKSVGMDDIRAASGVSLKRLYQVFPAKEQLVEAYLERRDVRWRGRLAAHVDRHAEPRERVLSVYDWLREWCGEDGFRGCAWINAYGELGATSEAVAAQVRAHKEAFRGYLGALVEDAGLPAALTGPLFLLAEGAMVTAGITGSAEPAAEAREAAWVLLTRGR